MSAIRELIKLRVANYDYIRISLSSCIIITITILFVVGKLIITLASQILC